MKNSLVLVMNLFILNIIQAQMGCLLSFEYEPYMNSIFKEDPSIQAHFGYKFPSKAKLKKYGKYLKMIHLYKDNSPFIPSYINQFSQLEVLAIMSGKISEKIKGFKYLKQFSSYFTSYDKIPDFVWNSPNMEFIELDIRNSRNVDSLLYKRLPNLRGIGLTFSKMDEIPLFFFEKKDVCMLKIGTKDTTKTKADYVKKRNRFEKIIQNYPLTKGLIQELKELRWLDLPIDLHLYEEEILSLKNLVYLSAGYYSGNSEELEALVRKIQDSRMPLQAFSISGVQLLYNINGIKYYKPGAYFIDEKH